MSKVTVHCVDGFIVTGILKDQFLSFTGLKWIKVYTKKGTIVINSEYIITIEYGNSNNSR